MKKILVIEDDVTLRENTCDFLKEEGYEVIPAEDGLEGLQMAMNHLPDLIICDIMMPKMNGYDFYKTIQQIKATSTIPLIFLTAKSEKEDIRAGMQLGADDYIMKPFDFNELLLSIQTRLNKFEKIMQKNDEKFYAFIDNPFVGVFIYQNQKFAFVNEKCAKTFGLAPHDFSNLKFNDLIAEQDREPVMSKIDRCTTKAQNTVHARFKAINMKTKGDLAVEIFAGMVNFKGVDSLIGNIAECGGSGSKMLFSDAKDQTALSLSKSERKILALVCQGLSNAEMAEKLGRSKRTIETHRANIMNKTGVKNAADLVIYTLRNNLI